ncbi:cation:proton antiporter [Candidatus Woesearchaeota archaeon]|nr:cation:proton antiporter [Candidatus Woesearchaeota archaeon]
MDPEIFVELSKILVLTILITGVAKILKQPVIIGYIISGIVAGPFLLNIIDSVETFTAFSHIGVALLLFFVGINLNPKVIKEVGKISLITGVGQVLFTTSIGFFIAKMMGFSNIVSFYISIALAFSSTIVIMKLLSDKRDLESLYGRISIGFLIIQDFIAIIVLLVISSLNNGTDLASMAVETVLKGIGGILVLFALTIYILPSLTKIIARSQEFLLLFSISWCFAVSSVFYYLNFSIEAGALLAGITLSLSPYHFEISSKLKPLRDFFIILFFIMIGSQMVFSNILQNMGIIILLSLFVLIGNPIIVMILMGLLGYTKRNSFLAGLTVAQISEFSLIVVTMGVSVGHVSNEILSLVTAVGLITFAGSTYMILYSNRIYPILSPYLSLFEREGKKVDEHRHHREDKHDIILFGYNRIGFDILESLKKIKKRFLIVDYDPEVITNLSKEGYECRYGDANDSELLNELDYASAKMIISTIPITETNLLIISKVKEVNSKVIITVVSHQIDDAVKLYDAGATYVIMPHFLGGKHFSTMIEKNRMSMNKFLKEKIIHIENIGHRKGMGHEHPMHEHN